MEHERRGSGFRTNRLQRELRGIVGAHRLALGPIGCSKGISMVKWIYGRGGYIGCYLGPVIREWSYPLCSKRFVPRGNLHAVNHASRSGRAAGAARVLDWPATGRRLSRLCRFHSNRYRHQLNS